MKIVFAVAVTALLFFSWSCTKHKITNEKIEGKWGIISLSSTGIRQYFLYTDTPTIHFNTVAKTIEGRTFCNTYTGKFKIKNRDISFHDIVATENPCKNDTDGGIFYILNHASNITFEGPNRMYVNYRDWFIECVRPN